MAIMTAMSRILAGLLCLILTACAESPFRSEAEQCRYLLDRAYAELDSAKAINPSAAADITRAAGLISAATVQRQFDKHSLCIDKVERARELLAPYRG